MDDELDDTVPKQTREEARSEAAAFRSLAESLARGKPAELPNPPFEGELAQAVVDARRFVKNARPRQIRRLAALLRQAGTIEMFTTALEGKSAQHYHDKAREHAVEAWRARLLAEGDAALDELMEGFPTGDRKRMRQLTRQARRAPAEARSKKAATALLRLIRALVIEAEPDATEQAPAGSD